MIQKLFQSRNAGTIKIDSMLAGGDLGFDSHSPRHIPGQTNGDGNIIVDRLGDGFGDTHHSEDRHAVAASHERPRHGHDGQIVDQAFQSRITTGPIDTIEKDVALTARRDELALIEARQEHAVVVGLQTQCRRMPDRGAGGKAR